jgi:hypothetical protein
MDLRLQWTTGRVKHGIIKGKYTYLFHRGFFVPLERVFQGLVSVGAIDVANLFMPCQPPRNDIAADTALFPHRCAHRRGMSLWAIQVASFAFRSHG